MMSRDSIHDLVNLTGLCILYQHDIPSSSMLKITKSLSHRAYIHTSCTYVITSMQFHTIPGISDVDDCSIVLFSNNTHFSGIVRDFQFQLELFWTFDKVIVNNVNREVHSALISKERYFDHFCSIIVRPPWDMVRNEAYGNKDIEILH